MCFACIQYIATPSIQMYTSYMNRLHLFKKEPQSSHTVFIQTALIVVNSFEIHMDVIYYELQCKHQLMDTHSKVFPIK